MNKVIYCAMAFLVLTLASVHALEDVSQMVQQQQQEGESAAAAEPLSVIRAQRHVPQSDVLEGSDTEWMRFKRQLQRYSPLSVGSPCAGCVHFG